MRIRPAIAGALLSAMTLSAVGANAKAQPSGKSDEEEKGFTFYETFQGSSNTLGQVTKLDTTVGYNLNRYFGVDAGIPVYFVHSSTTSSTAGASSNGIGNAYVDLRLTVNNPAVNFASTLTGTAPTGDTATGFSTGRATFDWNNHFDRAFFGITPFADVGIANTISDTHFFVRPFTTLGLVAHFEGGASYRVLHFFNLGASVYDVLPSGQQKVFSKLIKRHSSDAGMPGNSPGHRGRGGVFEAASETVGPADIARDNGFSAWIGASPLPFLDLEAGYNHSVHYALDTFSFGLGFNLGYLAKKARAH